MTVTTLWKQKWKSCSASSLWGADSTPCWLLGGVCSNSLIGCFCWRPLWIVHRLSNSSAKWDCLKSINCCFLLRFPSCPPCPQCPDPTLPMLGYVHSTVGTSALSDASLHFIRRMQAFVCSFLTFSLWKVKVVKSAVSWTSSVLLGQRQGCSNEC